MLYEFIESHREVIIARARNRVAERTSPPSTNAELTHGVPVFLEQLTQALRRERPRDASDPEHGQLGRTAALHGHDLLRMGLTIAQVVHGYGDVCQVVTQLASAEGERISSDEFQTLNLCLDNAIAEAVTEYSRQREEAIVAQGTERLAVLAHELRNHLSTAMLSFATIKKGAVGVSGATGQVLARSLINLRDLIDRSLAAVRLDTGITNLVPISVATLFEDVEVAETMQAKSRGVQLVVVPVASDVWVAADRQVLTAAISNLLQNAFKFTRPSSRVRLQAAVTEDRVRLEVEDECGGLPPGKADELFLPYSQRGDDRSGLGLGLAISLRAAQANGGELTVRNLPGRGCVFVIDLPRKSAPSSSRSEGALRER